MNQPLQADTTLLVIDDAEDNCSLLKQKLEKSGYRVEVATDGQEALFVLNRRRIDMVLLDLIMPVMNGFTVLEKMRANKNFANIPVIIMSSIDDEDTARDCLEFGASKYIYKPLDMRDVLGSIKECLQH
jgi:DNA-binding response OmpR family regulator